MIGSVDLQAGVQQAWSSVVEVAPKLLLCVVILVIGYIVARLVERILDRVLGRLGFDRMLERAEVKRAMSHAGIDVVHLLGRIVFYAIMLVVLATAFGVFGPNPVALYLDAVIAYLPRLFAAVVILIVALAVAGSVRLVLRGTLGGLSYGDLLASVAAAVIIGFGVIAALDQLSIAPRIVDGVFYALLAAVVGIAIVAVGGGGIEPMRERWRAALRTYDEGRDTVRDERRAMRTSSSYAGAQAPVDLRTGGADADDRSSTLDPSAANVSVRSVPRRPTSQG